MTSLYTEKGEQIPCTVIEAGPCPVVQLRTPDVDGYSAVQVGFLEKKEKNVNKPLKGHFSKSGVKPTRYLKEFRDFKKELQIGENLTVEQFVVGDKLKIHHFGGVGMSTHGQSDRQRHPGSVGQSSYPSRIIKGVRMAGRMGGKQSTVRNIQIVEVLHDQNLILVRGSIPGPKNSLLEIIKL